MSEIIKNRYEFIILFDVENGNPNGDPDAGNMPRIDVETGNGIVTDVCIKRKIRNYIELSQKEKPGFRIYVKEGAILNNLHKEAYESLKINPEDKKKSKHAKNELSEFMCKNFFDIRTFGAVMSTTIDCGVIRGPVQINFARSIDPILQSEVTITRMAVTSEKDADDKHNEMGRKHVIPYALFRAEGYISAMLAQNKTGFTEDDLELFWESIINMFEHDHSSARGKMAVRKLILFKHDTALGNYPSHKLFDLVNVQKKDPIKPARKYEDYNISIENDLIPEGVKIIQKI